MNRKSLLRGAVTGALCAAAISTLFLVSRSFFGAEYLVYDLLSRRLATTRAVDDRIVIVSINEKSVANLAEIYGRPPYSRGAYALILEELRQAGAKVVAFDILFDQENATDPDGDRRFADVLAGGGSILGAQAQPGTAAAMPADFHASLWSIRGHPGRVAHSIVAPHPSFRGASGVGTVRLHTGDSAVVRRYALADRVANGHVGGLALECVREFAGLPRTAAVRRGMNGPYLELARRNPVPIDDDLSLLIRWSAKRKGAKPEDMIRYNVVDFDRLVLVAMARQDPSTGVSQSDIDRFAEQFRGKIVLVAYTASGLFDLRPTPLSSASAGVEIHANAIDNLLNNDFNRPVQPWFVIPLLLLTGALFGALAMSIASHIGGAALTLGSFGVILGGAYGALSAGHVLPAVSGAATLGLTYLAVTVVKYIAEQAHSAQLQATFGRYVSPQILTHILAHPEKVRLGGERRELTILFSDIRGFTSISEAAEPEEVVEMLNEYLTKMVEILLANGGTLDKFIGDAVMGFWNAPVGDPDHARHAVTCAIEMLEETARIRERWEKEGKASLRIGIGINTGDAVAGNIGAEQVFSYTVIGDAVNLASRLESKNKDYGTELIVSEFTLARIADEFDVVYLDEVKVKGKDKAVKIYDVRGRAKSAAAP